MYSYSGIGSIKHTLNNGKFTESEVKATKSIAKCRIHVKRASARREHRGIFAKINSERSKIFVGKGAKRGIRSPK